MDAVAVVMECATGSDVQWAVIGKRWCTLNDSGGSISFIYLPDV